MHTLRLGENVPRRNPLTAWYTGTIENTYGTKSGDVEPGVFEKVVIPKFSPDFTFAKDLARKLREILFSKGVLYTGTPEKPEELYSPMIQAFDEMLDW